MARWVVKLVVVFLLIGLQRGMALEDTPTPPPAETILYTVQHGDTLGLIAFRNHTTVAEIARLNNLDNPQLIVIGQQLRLPAPTGSLATPSAPINSTPDVEATPELSAEALATPVIALALDYGVEVDFSGQNVDSTVARITALGMHWVKIEARWRELEATRGVIDYTTLDAAVDSLRSNNLNILMTITTAPDWARSSHVENGPPDDLSLFAQFAGELAKHYAGRVQAYEIWNEPNLRREWNSTVFPINAEVYASLLRSAYGAIKAADPAAVVISAGLAPTGFNDGSNAVDDRVYLDDLYAQGLIQFSDAVGAHPYGFANPPDATCCAAPDGVLTHYGHPSFYFLDTLADYHVIMIKYGDENKLIWVTRFGWGTSVDTAAPPHNSAYVSYNSLEQQAQYLIRGFELGGQLGYVGVMIDYNLNGCVVQPENPEACYYSLLSPTGEKRPAFDRLALIFANATP